MLLFITRCLFFHEWKWKIINDIALFFFLFRWLAVLSALGSTDVSMATDKCNLHSLTLASLQTQIDINLLYCVNFTLVIVFLIVTRYINRELIKLWFTLQPLVIWRLNQLFSNFFRGQLKSYYDIFFIEIKLKTKIGSSTFVWKNHKISSNFFYSKEYNLL